jgi:hypothetical protein
MDMKKLISPLLIIVLAVALRLLPHPPNVVPITALALFGGVYLNKKYALIIPLLVMFISDLFLGFHNTIPYVYGSFLLSGLIGLWLRQHKKTSIIIIAALLSSLLFFIITNFGVWLVSGMYSHSITGLINCYVLALPFYRNTILGDLIYVGVFFGAYELACNVNFVNISKIKVQISNLSIRQAQDPESIEGHFKSKK